MKEFIDTKEAKIRRIATAIANMEVGDSISPTNLFKSIKIHPNTGRDLLDLHDLLSEIGFKTIRDKNGKIKEILRTDEELSVRRDIREIKKEILDIKEFLDKPKKRKK